ncbi:PREDICTED: uncharacterized protein LOC105461514 [Wasmannia auropunctata]|uniref:uncharacterized protein LOC105461514 n=1 Tax=Wasmannia auropunctata TaxID=64793 RepID=UPI0005EE4E35|nr:PREDICTED: uncharacterized protein LOC105461514 [Wasmannia auropunctata]
MEHTLNKIIHLDGVQARPPKAAQFNNGNVSFELQIQSNSIVSNWGKYKPIRMIEEEPELVKMENLLNTVKPIIIKGYVKTNFTSVNNKKYNKIIGCGSITNGYYKIEVHITNFKEDDYTKFDINKGDHVEIIGTMQTTVKPPYLEVNNLNDIKKIEGHMPINELLKGNHLPKRKNEESSTDVTQSKKRREIIPEVGTSRESAEIFDN